MAMAELSHLALSGAEFHIRVTPRASRARVIHDGDLIRIWVTVVAEDGKANRAVQAALAQALGVAKTRLVLLRGQTARDKLFRLE
jgi:uncharacterized protein